MKVVYEKTITEKITDSINQAGIVNKKINYILLTREEAVRFWNEARPRTFYHTLISDENKILELHGGYYLGEQLRVEGYE